MGFYIDANALKTRKPGINWFAFRFNPLLKNETNGTNIMKSNFEPYNYAWDGQRTTLFTNPTYGCNNSGSYCTKLIQMNGWKVPKDYPFKF